MSLGYFVGPDMDPLGWTRSSQATVSFNTSMNAEIQSVNGVAGDFSPGDQVVVGVRYLRDDALTTIPADFGLLELAFEYEA